MTRRPFDPNELDGTSGDARRAVSELQSYLSDTATRAPRALEQRVMAAVEQEPAPRRGFLSWLLTPSTSGTGVRRFARAGLLAATLVVAVTGALFAGQLADLVRNVGSGSPTPTESVSPMPSESVLPDPSNSPEPTPSASPERSEDANPAEASGTPEASEDENSQGSPAESGDGQETSGPSGSQGS